LIDLNRGKEDLVSVIQFANGTEGVFVQFSGDNLRGIAHELVVVKEDGQRWTPKMGIVKN
jgi:hypothetical protein